MGKHGPYTLSDEQTERICEIAEEAARRNVMSKVPNREIADLSISAGLEDTETLNLEVEVETLLAPSFESANASELAQESVKAAFEAAGMYLRETGCRFKR